MFRKTADFESFEAVMVEAHRREPVRILSYCVLSNHWHFVGQMGDANRQGVEVGAHRWSGGPPERCGAIVTRYGPVVGGIPTAAALCSISQPAAERVPV
jgi:hypothetical protein